MSNLLRSCLSPMVILGAIGLAVLIVITVISLAIFSRPVSSTAGLPPAALTVLPGPTATIAGVPSPDTSQTELPERPQNPGEGQPKN